MSISLSISILALQDVMAFFAKKLDFCINVDTGELSINSEESAYGLFGI